MGRAIFTAYRTYGVFVVAGPFAVALTATMLASAFMPIGVHVPVPNWTVDAIGGAEMTARFWVVTTLLALIAVSVGAAVAAAMVMLRAQGSWMPGILCAGIFAGLAILLVALIPHYLMEFLGAELFAKTIGNFPRQGHGTPIGTFIRVGGYAGYGAAAFIAVSLCVLLPKPPPVITSDSSDQGRAALDGAVRDLALKIRELKYLLCAASAVLFVTILFAKAWREWPLAYFAGAELAPDRLRFQAQTDATLSYDAFYYVLLLAAAFVPMALRLRRAGLVLAGLNPAIEKDPAAGKRWLTANGVMLPAKEQYQRVLAIAAPFLAAPGLEMFKRFTEMIGLAG